jgi:hypothetical protein
MSTASATEARSIEDLNARGGYKRAPKATLLPEPEQRPIRVPLVSADDHVVEPGDIFMKRMPTKFGDLCPHVTENEFGVELWHFEDVAETNGIRGTSAVGRPIDEWMLFPVRFDEMRRGSWNPVARVEDMDIAGVALSRCFPSACSASPAGGFSRSRTGISASLP